MGCRLLLQRSESDKRTQSRGNGWGWKMLARQIRHRNLGSQVLRVVVYMRCFVVVFVNRVRLVFDSLRLAVAAYSEVSRVRLAHGLSEKRDKKVVTPMRVMAR